MSCTIVFPTTRQSDEYEKGVTVGILGSNYGVPETQIPHEKFYTVFINLSLIDNLGTPESADSHISQLEDIISDELEIHRKSISISWPQDPTTFV